MTASVAQISSAELDRRLTAVRNAAHNLPRIVEEEDGPNWFSLLVLDFVREALENLRRCIDDPSTPEISWDNPVMEGRWEVEWNWELDRPRFLEIERADLTLDRDPFAATAASRISSLAWKYALHGLTNNVVFRWRGGKVRLCLPPAELKHIESLDPIEREALLNVLHRPFVVFGKRKDPAFANYTVELSASSSKLTRSLPAELPFTIATANSAVLCSGRIIVAFHPLVVDDDEQRAYFPCVARIRFDSRASEAESKFDPSILSQWGFWDVILRSVDSMIERMSTVASDRPTLIEVREALQNDRIVIVPHVSRNQEELRRAIRGCTYELAAMAERGDQITEPLKMTRRNTGRCLVRFPFLSGLRWVEVSVVFLSDEMIQVSARGIVRRYTFAELGFKDGRRGDSCDTRWAVLRKFAEERGRISWKTTAEGKQQTRATKAVEQIRKRLKALLGIDDDPFHPYRKAHAYETKFSICLGSDCES